MEELIKIAMKALKDNYDVNEIELSDGTNRVRVIRNTPTPTIWNSPPSPYSNM